MTPLSQATLSRRHGGLARARWSRTRCLISRVAMDAPAVSALATIFPVSSPSLRPAR